MALTPRAQLRQLLIGTLGAFICALTLVLTNQSLEAWAFYTLSVIMGAFIIYALAGYIGVWMWRMRKTLFNMD